MVTAHAVVVGMMRKGRCRARQVVAGSCKKADGLVGMHHWLFVLRSEGRGGIAGIGRAELIVVHGWWVWSFVLDSDACDLTNH